MRPKSILSQKIPHFYKSKYSVTWFSKNWVRLKQCRLRPRDNIKLFARTWSLYTVAKDKIHQGMHSGVIDSENGAQYLPLQLLAAPLAEKGAPFLKET